MGKDADAIRNDIEDTRARLGDTVEAIGYKADIPNRARDAVNDRVDAARSAVSAGVETVKSAVSDGMSKMSAAASDGVSSVTAAVSSGMNNARSAFSGAASKVADAVPSADDLRAGADRAGAIIRDNPVGMAVGAVAAGFLMGLLLPRTSVEQSRMRDMKRMAKDAGAQVVEAGKQMVRDTVSTTFGSTRRADDSGTL